MQRAIRETHFQATQTASGASVSCYGAQWRRLVFFVPFSAKCLVVGGCLRGGMRVCIHGGSTNASSGAESMLYVLQVKFAEDNRAAWVTTKPNAPGGKRTEKVGLAFDEDLFPLLVVHNVEMEVSVFLHHACSHIHILKRS